MRISFTQLEISKRSGNSYELIMNFDVDPVPSATDPVNLQYAIYDEHNQIITTLVLGYRKYPIGSNVYPQFTTTSKNVRVVAWLTDDTLIRTYDIFSTTGAKEFNRISDVAIKTIPLIISPIIPPPTPPTPPPVMTPPEPTPAPVAEPTPVGNLNPYQLTTTINPKWILLAVVGVGILSAIIFIMRRRA